MAAEREPEWSDDEGGDDSSVPGWRTPALAGRMRLGDPAAFAQFIERYRPVMCEMAMRYGGTRDFGESIVLDVLHDVAEAIRAHRVPRDVRLGAYLVGALRRHILGLREKERRHAMLDGELAIPLDGAGEAAIPGTVSEYTLGATRPPDFDVDVDVDGAHDEIVRRYHAFVRSIVSADEWMLLGWKGERVPGREMAAWTGTSHGALRVRLHRLGERVIAHSRRWLATLDAPERAYLERRYLDRLRPVTRRRQGGTNA